MVQAGLYPNPTIGYENNPNANNTGSGVQGAFIDQVIKTGGKLTIAVAGARMAMVAAELALKQARYALATTIRGDFYTLLVAQETVRVNRGLAHFTDEIFRLQADLLGGGFAASHEPTALRSQAFIVRLALQAIHCQLHLCLEAACRRHGPEAVAAQRRRGAGRSAHPIL